MRPDAVGVVGRLVGAAEAVRRGARTIGLVGLGAAAVISLVVLLRWTPGSGEDWAVFGILSVLVVIPPAVLLGFSIVLREVVGLPDKLRSYPGTMREHADALRTIAREARARKRQAWWRLPSSTWRLATLLGSARELLAPRAALLPLLNVPFLIATVVSALLVPVLVLAALVTLVAAAAA